MRLTRQVEKTQTRTIREESGRVCDGCGLKQELEPGEWRYYGDNIWWIPIKVEAGESGEEGNQEVEKIFCEDCSPEVLSALVTLGFSTHYHGSTNFIEDSDCPGYQHMDKCPTPQWSRYGNEEE